MRLVPFWAQVISFNTPPFLLCAQMNHSPSTGVLWAGLFSSMRPVVGL
jgi:hypothetical protein